MRILVAGKEKLTKEQEREWSPDGQGRIRHMVPDARGPWHYAYSAYILVSGERTKFQYYCPQCDRGALLDES